MSMLIVNNYLFLEKFYFCFPISLCRVSGGDGFTFTIPGGLACKQSAATTNRLRRVGSARRVESEHFVFSFFVCSRLRCAEGVTVSVLLLRTG